MNILPARRPRYQTGGSTPRSLRVNDLLWRDFARLARLCGWTAAEALRWMMEQAIVDGVLSERQPSAGGRLSQTASNCTIVKRRRRASASAR